MRPENESIQRQKASANIWCPSWGISDICLYIVIENHRRRRCATNMKRKNAHLTSSNPPKYKLICKTTSVRVQYPHTRRPGQHANTIKLQGVVNASKGTFENALVSTSRRPLTHLVTSVTPIAGLHKLCDDIRATRTQKSHLGEQEKYKYYWENS